MSNNKYQKPTPAKAPVVAEEPKDASNEPTSETVSENTPVENTTVTGTESTAQASEETPESKVTEPTGEPVAALEPTPAVVEPVVPVVTEHTPTTETPIEAPVVAPVETIVVDQYAGLSVISKTLLELVDRHIETLDPKRPMNVEQQIASQRSFSATLLNIFKLADAKDFIAVMDILVKKIVQNADGAFSEKRAFLHWAQIPLANERLKAFEYNLIAIMSIAKASDRKQAIRSIDYGMAFPNLNDQERSRLTAYFKRLAGA